jgi:hypothetical protein
LGWGHRYLLSLEGNDIASNLAWMLGHNSVVVMPPPQWETFLLQGLLRPWVHYVPVHSPADVPHVLSWMRANEAACLQIIANANAWVEHLLGNNARTLWLATDQILQKIGIRNTSAVLNNELRTRRAGRGGNVAGLDVSVWNELRWN